ncbi:leucine/isoleucine/valine transporter permease subunit [Methyloligella halotolerans]|uniref:Leucine/isoleucine/valine transporter permease subunit n=1 Tax=Methyloligella halotolerans TaxID=1177755 RepID=A0A1E2S3F7_9HYPH|nr:high-affinity branched-chain amino acid ABC transporter permease LivM [Methyloligella halotolerans]ODA68865.1 leucine/isoleucine/valine transporter permease subunit [Methyloligella halotolerans]
MEPAVREKPRLLPALWDAAIAAGIAFLLFCLVLGVRTVDGVYGLTLQPRPVLLAVVVGIVFFGRLALNLFWWDRDWRFPPLPFFSRTAKDAKDRAPRDIYRVGLVLIGFAAVFPLLGLVLNKVFGANLPLLYLIDLSILVLTYVMLGWGLNIVVGLAGLLDLGYVAFYAVGAYTFAILATTFGWSFWMCLPLAGILAAFWGIVLGFPVLRLRGDYLAIVTLAFGEIIRIVIQNWTELTGGPNGISNIPEPSFFGLEFAFRGDNTFHQFFGLPYDAIYGSIWLYYIILVMALITNAVTLRLRRLPIGRAWEALREDEIACRSLGMNTTTTKLSAFATGALFGGFAGSFFAARQSFISPESFTFIESAIILSIVVLGGMGSQLGVAIAAVVMIGGFEALRHTDSLQLVFGTGFDPTLYRMLFFGLAMVAIMVWRPRGLVSTRQPTVTLNKDAGSISKDLVSEGSG